MGLRLSHIVQVLIKETKGAAASYCDLIANFLIPAEKRTPTLALV
jgi:hypothetical protein